MWRSYVPSLTPITMVASAFLPGAESSTVWAPLFRCTDGGARLRPLEGWTDVSARGRSR